MSDASLAGRHALVTGGGHGIGGDVATALVRQGARVTLLGRNEARLAEQVARCAPLGQVQSVTADVSKGDQVEAAFRKAVEGFGLIDILVNNAGTADSAPFTKLTEENWRKLFGVNVDGVFHCTQQVFGPMLAAKWGRVINIASVAGVRGYRYISAYCATKHAVIGLTRVLALEAAKSGVTVNAICPGYVDTELTQQNIRSIAQKTGMSEADALASLVSANPQGRLIQPEEIARTVVWLCSPGSESVTGQSIMLAGGEIT